MNINNTQTNVFNSNVTIHGTLSGSTINTSSGLYPGVHATTGKVGNCATFDGINGGGAYNSKLITNSFGVNVVNNFTLSVWIKPRSFSAYQHIIGAPFQNRLNIGANGTALTFNLYNGTAFGIIAPVVAADTWHHYVFIRDANTLKLYADNVHIGSASVAGASFTNGSVFSVGGGEYDEYYFNGAIDELAYWNAPLTTQQITTLYNGGNGTNYAGSPHVNLVAYWSLNESSGTRYDSHGSNHLSEFPVTQVALAGIINTSNGGGAINTSNGGGAINTSRYFTDCSDAVSKVVATVDGYEGATCSRSSNYNSMPSYGGVSQVDGYEYIVKYDTPQYINTIVVTGAGIPSANGTYTRAADGATNFTRTIANGSVPTFIEFSEYDGANALFTIRGTLEVPNEEEGGTDQYHHEYLYGLTIENGVVYVSPGYNDYGVAVSPVPTTTHTTATAPGRWRIDVDGQYAEANVVNVPYPWLATWAGAGSSSGTVTKAACPAPAAGGTINTAGGAVGAGGSINLSNGGGSITMIGNAGEGYPSVAGSINLSAGAGGNGGSINLQGAQSADGSIKAAGGSINLSAGLADNSPGGSIISTGGENVPGGTLNMSAVDQAGGSINTSNGGGSINTSGGEYGIGGSINLSNNGGSILASGGDGNIGGSLNMSANDDYAGGSINTTAGGDGAGGYINTSDGGGSINTAGYGGNAGGGINTGASEDGGAGGYINTAGGVNNGGNINTSNGGGYINTSGSAEYTGGFINTSEAGGYINTSGSNDGNTPGGYINTSSDNENTGGFINTSALEEGGNGGYINTSGGGDGTGGSIDTSNGGGSINTRGTGSIQLGDSGTRTTLNGSAAGVNKTITLPDANGTIALTTDISKTIADSLYNSAGIVITNIKFRQTLSNPVYQAQTSPITAEFSRDATSAKDNSLAPFTTVSGAYRMYLVGDHLYVTSAWDTNNEEWFAGVQSHMLHGILSDAAQPSGRTIFATYNIWDTSDYNNYMPMANFEYCEVTWLKTEIKSNLTSGKLVLGNTDRTTTIQATSTVAREISLPNASGTVALVSQTIAFAIALG